MKIRTLIKTIIINHRFKKMKKTSLELHQNLKLLGGNSMSEKDRLNANEYHYLNYKDILIALDNKDEAEARAICTREMNIIDEDISIENDDDIEEKSKIIELADLENLPSSEEYK